MKTKRASVEDIQPAAKLRIVRDADLAQGVDFYRCPACGEMVDGNQMADVRLHHDHVRHPAPQPHWFELRASETETAAVTRPQPANPPLRMWPNESYAPSPADRSRRYGHG